jgi:hypothetical protein
MRSHRIRVPEAAILLASVAAAALAQEAGQRGIELSDMNRSVEACSDFYEFANGSPMVRPAAQRCDVL